MYKVGDKVAWIGLSGFTGVVTRVDKTEDYDYQVEVTWEDNIVNRFTPTGKVWNRDSEASIRLLTPLEQLL